MTESRTPQGSGAFRQAVTPPKERYEVSYYVNEDYEEEVQYPPAVAGVRGAVDLHCHAGPGRRDPLAVVQLASQSGMRAILFRTISDWQRTAEAAGRLQAALDAWCAEQEVDTRPVGARPASTPPRPVARSPRPPSASSSTMASPPSGCRSQPTPAP